MTTQNRLKSERERLGFSQSAFAELAKVGKTTVINWEKGASAPDAIQLGFLSAAGLDVLYVINGLRSQGLPVQNTLPPDQQVLLSSYERCQPEAKQHLIQTAALLSAGMQPVNSDKPSRKNVVKVSSTHGHAAGRDVHVTKGGPEK